MPEQRNMKYHFLILTAVLALVAVILSTSLVTAGRVSSFGDKASLFGSNRRLYLSRQLQPDNVLYPARMAKDAVVFKTAPEEEQTALCREYAGERLDSVFVLIEREEFELALSTLTKAQKYMLTYCQTAPRHEQNTIAAQTHMYAFLRDAEVAIDAITLPDVTSATDLQKQLLVCTQSSFSSSY